MTWHFNKWGAWMVLLPHISFHVEIPFIYLGCWPRQEYCFYFINSRQKARELCSHFQLLIEFESLWGFSDSTSIAVWKFVIQKAFEIELERGRCCLWDSCLEMINEVLFFRKYQLTPCWQGSLKNVSQLCGKIYVLTKREGIYFFLTKYIYSLCILVEIFFYRVFV